MRRGLRTQISLTIALLILLTITLISILSNIYINEEFGKYMEKEQKAHSQEIADNLSRQFNGFTQEWDVSFIHGLGMYALYDGYIIKLYDRNGDEVWDAENHDMSLCAQIMTQIADRMKQRRPEIDGKMITTAYDLQQNGRKIGAVSISYYGPYFLSENDFQFLNALNFILLAIGSLALLGSLLAGYFLAKRITRPIIKTAHVAAQIAEGNYDIRFEGKTKTRELDQLVTAVNHMAVSLDRQENLRKRLTTDVAHELRTPLTAVSSHLEAMIEGVWEPTTARLRSCYEETGRISGLVADLEQLAKVESEILNLEKAQVDLLELAEQVCGNFENESEKKSIELAVKGESSTVVADKDRLNQVITNLVSNAIKYTSENGYVRVTVKDTDKSSVLTVEDDGIGISQKELPLIFERFYRTDRSRNRKTGGAGIGLTIVKSIVTAHGGIVTAQSNGERGSCFTVVLPKQ